jgi:hypothetical protein
VRWQPRARRAAPVDAPATLQVADPRQLVADVAVDQEGDDQREGDQLEPVPERRRRCRDRHVAQEQAGRASVDQS